MTTDQATPLLAIAEATADLLICSGCTPSLDDDQVEALAEALLEFLKAAGVPVDLVADAAHSDGIRDRDRVFDALAKDAPFFDDGLC